MCIYISVFKNVYVYTYAFRIIVCMHICVYICICIYMYVLVCVCKNSQWKKTINFKKSKEDILELLKGGKGKGWCNCINFQIENKQVLKFVEEILCPNKSSHLIPSSEAAHLLQPQHSLFPSSEDYHPIPSSQLTNPTGIPGNPLATAAREAGRLSSLSPLVSKSKSRVSSPALQQSTYCDLSALSPSG